MIPTYKPSGKFGVLTLPLLLVGMVLIILLAYVYQMAIVWIPFIYINVLLTVGMGIAIGTISSVIISHGRIRSIVLGCAIAVVLTGTGLSAKFVFQFIQYSQAVSEFKTELLATPEFRDLSEEEKDAMLRQVEAQSTFASHIEARVEEGWSIGRAGGGMPLTGPFVYIIWLIEAGIMVVVSVKRARNSAQVPYNETVDSWANEVDVVMTLPITSSEMVAQIEAADSVDDLLTIPIPQTDESDTFAVYTVNSVMGQEMEDAYLSVTKIVLSVNAKGEQETTATSIVSNAILSKAQRERLVENASLMQEAFADYREALEEEAAEEAAAAEAEASSNELPGDESSS